MLCSSISLDIFPHWTLRCHCAAQDSDVAVITELRKENMACKAFLPPLSWGALKHPLLTCRGEPWNNLTVPLLAQQAMHLSPFHWAHTSQIKNWSTGRSGNCWPRPHNQLHTDPGLTSLLPHVGFSRFPPYRGLCFSSLALKTWTAVFCHLTKV